MAPQHKGGSWSHRVCGFCDQRQSHAYPKYLLHLNQENRNPKKEPSSRRIGWVEILCYRQRRERKPQGPFRVLRVRMSPKSLAELFLKFSTKAISSGGEKFIRENC